MKIVISFPILALFASLIFCQQDVLSDVQQGETEVKN